MVNIDKEVQDLVDGLMGDLTNSFQEDLEILPYFKALETQKIVEFLEKDFKDGNNFYEYSHFDYYIVERFTTHEFLDGQVEFGWAESKNRLIISFVPDFDPNNEDVTDFTVSYDKCISDEFKPSKLRLEDCSIQPLIDDFLKIQEKTIIEDKIRNLEYLVDDKKLEWLKLQEEIERLKTLI